MAYCPKCGTKSPDGAKFCNACGTPLPQAAPAPQPSQPQPDKAQQPPSSEQPIQAPFPQQAMPPQGTVRQLPPQQPPQGMPPGFAPYSQPPKKRHWGIVFAGLIIVLGGFYYIGSASKAQQPAVQPIAQPQGTSPGQGTPQEPPASPQAPSGTTGQQPAPKNIVGRQAKIAYLEKTDQQVSSIMQGVTRGAGPEALNEVARIIEEINQTTLDNDEDDEALELLVLEISRLGCACEAIAEPAKKAQALQEESKLRQEFTRKFQAYKQSK